VSKFSYGASMPITPLSIPFTEPVMYGIKTYISAVNKRIQQKDGK
jgi:signal peptidase I